MSRSLHFVVPGDLDTRTGGYEYDRQISAGLGRRGWHVDIIALPGDYPEPSTTDREHAARAMAALPDGACVLADGLAFGVLADEAACEQERLGFIALVHHPLGLETGLDPVTTERLLASERRALATVRGVVVTSRQTVADVERLGVSSARIAVVEPGTVPAAPAHGSSGGVPQLLCVASVVPRKGQDTLLDALERLTHLPWHLTCVGSLTRHIDFAAAVARRAGHGRLAGRVTFAGELAGAPLEALWDCTDLFVLPTHHEGYGMVVAEALSRAIPVVSTGTGAIADLVSDTAGMLVPAGDVASLARALELLLTSDEALARVRQGARVARASVPTWESACLRMEEALTRFGGQ